MTLTEKVAYLKGLMEGLNINKDTAEGKVLCAMADILEDMSTSVVDLEDSMAEVQGYLDELDDDLADVEDIIYEDEDEDDYYDDEEDDEDFIDDDDFIEVECPYCGETVYFDDSVDPDDLKNKWSEIRKIIRSIPSHGQCRAAMEKAGCKLTVKDIGKDEGLFADCIEYSPYMRHRLTLLRLKNMII